MQWEITGADRVTGADKTIIIEADTEDSARRRGNRAGLVVEAVRPLEAGDSVAGVTPVRIVAPVAPPIAPPLVVPTHVTYAHSPVTINQGPLTNGWGIASAILGSVAVVLALIPCIGIIPAGFLGLVGLILAVIGIVTGYSYRRPVMTSWIGGGLCIAAPLVWLFVMAVLGAGLNTAAQKAQAQAAAQQAARQNRSASGLTPRGSLSDLVPTVPDPVAQDTAGPEAEWVDGTVGVTAREMLIRVESVERRKVTWVGMLSNRTESPVEHLVVTLSVTNTSRTRIRNHNTWRGEHAQAAVATDATGRNVKPVRSPNGGNPDGSPGMQGIAPGVTVKDVLVFEVPAASAKELRLTLPMQQFGGTDSVRMRLPVR